MVAPKLESGHTNFARENWEVEPKKTIGDSKLLKTPNDLFATLVNTMCHVTLNIVRTFQLLYDWKTFVCSKIAIQLCSTPRPFRAKRETLLSKNCFTTHIVIETFLVQRTLKRNSCMPLAHGTVSRRSRSTRSSTYCSSAIYQRGTRNQNTIGNADTWV